MIILFAGNDVGAKHKASDKFLKALPRGTEVLEIEKSTWNAAQTQRLYSGAGSFSPKSAVIFSNILESAEMRDFLLPRLEKLQDSENYFIFLEGKLPKTTLDAFKKARAEINLYNQEEKKETRFNSFLLANALGAKNKLNLWIYFRQALARGVALEELAGVLFWKAKDMILKKNFGKWNEKELQNLASKFSYLLPEARRDGRDAEAAMEQYLLEGI